MSTIPMQERTDSAESELEQPRPGWTISLDGWETAVLLGLACLAVGGWMAWPPLGPIVLGLSLTGLGIMGTMAKARREAAARAEAARGERRGISG